MSINNKDRCVRSSFMHTQAHATQGQGGDGKKGGGQKGRNISRLRHLKPTSPINLPSRGLRPDLHCWSFVSSLTLKQLVSGQN